MQQLDNSTSIFIRGLPRVEGLQDRAVAHIFSNVLRQGSIRRADYEGGEYWGALRGCFRNGWLHADKFNDPHGVENTFYAFPSPLHRLFVEWRLYDITPVTSFEPNSILPFVLRVIARFSPRSLSTPRRISDACIQRPPEAQYQDEFYRSCHRVWNGLLTNLSEFGMAEGRVDFYIPSKQWAVEVLREGDRVKQHADRFSPEGPYGKKLPLSDFVLLDCRNDRWPTGPHSGMCIICLSIRFPFLKLTLHTDIPELYHVVFTNDYRDVSILDHLLRPVAGGELRLLYTA